MRLHIYAWPLLAVLLVTDLGIFAWALADHTVSGRGWEKCWRCLNGCLMLAALYGILRYTVLRKSGGHEAEFRFLRSWAEFMAQPELFREMVMNAFLFFPLGLTMPYSGPAEIANWGFFRRALTPSRKLSRFCRQ